MLATGGKDHGLNLFRARAAVPGFKPCLQVLQIDPLLPFGSTIGPVRSHEIVEIRDGKPGCRVRVRVSVRCRIRCITLDESPEPILVLRPGDAGKVQQHRVRHDHVGTRHVARMHVIDRAREPRGIVLALVGAKLPSTFVHRLRDQVEVEPLRSTRDRRRHATWQVVPDRHNQSRSPGEARSLTGSACRRYVPDINEEAALAEIRRAAQKTLDAWPEARAAVLFGSRARGNHRPDSDWDVAFIVRGDGERLESIPSGVPFSVPGVERSHYVNEIAIPERLVERKALCIGHVGRGIVTDGKILAGEWIRPKPEGRPYMETGRYSKSMYASLDAVDMAIEAAAEIERQDVWELNLAITDRFVACTADAAEHLAKAVMGRHGLDARHSHDLHRLADQARSAGHDALAEDFRRMNGATRHDHKAGCDGANVKSLARAVARLPVVFDLMRKELADIPESFFDPEQAGRLADTAARIFSNGAASLRDAMERDGTDMQPPEGCIWIALLIRSRETLASRLDDAAAALRDGDGRPGRDRQKPPAV